MAPEAVRAAQEPGAVVPRAAAQHARRLVNLHDRPDEDPAFASTRSDYRSMQVSRSQVGRFLAQAAEEQVYVHKTVALSAE